MSTTTAPSSRRLHRHHPRYRWVALSNTTLGMTMATINSSIVLISLPAIFRGIDASTHIFVTDRFRMACMKLGLSGMIFHPVAVA